MFQIGRWESILRDMGRVTQGDTVAWEDGLRHWPDKFRSGWYVEGEPAKGTEKLQVGGKPRMEPGKKLFQQEAVLSCDVD